LNQKITTPKKGLQLHQITLQTCLQKEAAGSTVCNTGNNASLIFQLTVPITSYMG